MIGIIVAILVFGFLIASHEFGHLLMAKLFKIGVPEFSVGMGPKLFGRKFGSTVYSLRLIPIGGFCALEGEDEVSDSPSAFGNKPVLQRILVVAGGPLFNLLTALFLSFILIFSIGANTPYVYMTDDSDAAISSGIQEGDVILSIDGQSITTGRDIQTYLLTNPLGDDVVVEYYRDGEVCETTYNTSYETVRVGITYRVDEYPAEVNVFKGQPAEVAGLKSGDIITAVNGVSIESGEALKEYFDSVGKQLGELVEFSVLRDEEPLEITVVPAMVDVSSLGFSADSFRDKNQGFLSRCYYSIQEVVSWEKYTVATIGQLVTGRLGVEDLAGPVGIVATVSDTVEESNARYDIGTTVLNVINMTILLAVNIGIMNLLPIPALDGGRLVFLFIELIFRRRVDPKAEAMVHAIGLGLLMLLMGFVMVQDGLRLLGVSIGT